MTEQDIRQETQKQLKNLGFGQHLCGFNQIVEAVVYLHSMQPYRVLMTVTVYPYVAALTNTTESRVERGIRNSIDRAWNKYSEAEGYDINNPWTHLLGRRYTLMKPTNSEFLYSLLAQVISDINKK